MKLKHCITIMLAIVMLTTLIGCSKELPSIFPDFNSNTSTMVNDDGDIDITPVNFYFDNIENTKAICYDSLITSGFMQSVISTNRSTFSTTDFHLKLDQGKYSIAENDKPLEDVYLEDSFYISNSDISSRESPGILNLLFNDESSMVNIDVVNVIFTDLSEKDIDKVARKIRESYLSCEEYNICVLTVSMKTKENYQPFYVSTGNNSIIKVDADGLDNRFYYLIMLGPTSKVASYVHCLKANIKESRLVGNSDYYITDYDYIQHTFNVEDNLNFESISNPDANLAFSNLYGYELETESTSQVVLTSTEETTTTSTVNTTNLTTTGALFENDNEKTFKTHIIRLDSMKDYYKQDIWHLKYNKKNTDGLDLSPKGYNGKSLDFSLQANMDLAASLPNKNIHYISLEKKSDGSIIYNGFPPTNSISENDMFFAFGAEEEVKFYQISDNEWEQLSEDRISRFFKEYSTDNGRLSIISDNTDEGGISEVYIVVPVYQVVVKKNYTPKWVDSRAYIIGQDFNGLDRYRKTYNLRQFYCLLFGINIENKENDIYVDETIIERSVIGYSRILITNI